MDGSVNTQQVQQTLQGRKIIMPKIPATYPIVQNADGADVPEKPAKKRRRIKKALGHDIYLRWQQLSENPNFISWLAASDVSERFYFNEQIDSEFRALLEARGQAIIEMNEVRPVIRHAVSVLTANNPAYELTGVTENDPMNAWIFREIVHYTMRESFFTKQMERSMRSTIIAGRGTILIYFDPDADNGKGDLRYKYIRRSDLLIDNDSSDWACQDSRDMAIQSVWNTNDVLDRWPQYSNAIHERKNKDIHRNDDHTGLESDTSINKEVATAVLGVDYQSDVNLDKNRIIEYFRRIPITIWVVKEFVAEVDEGGQPNIYVSKESEFYSDDDLAEYVDYLEQNEMVEGLDYELEQRQVKRIEHAICATDFILEYEILPTYYYPVIIISDEDTENPWQLGEIEFLKGKQEFLNKCLAIMVLNAQTSSNPRKFFEEGAIPAEQNVEEFINNSAQPGSVTILADGALQKGKYMSEQGQPLNNAFMALVQMMKQGIQAEVGMFSMAMGDPQNAPETYKATMQLREWALEKITPLLRSVDNAMTLLGKVAVKYIQYYYSEDKAIRIALDRTEPEFKKLEEAGRVNANGMMPINKIVYSASRVARVINDVSIGQYDIAAISRSYLPTNTMAKAMVLKDFAEAGILDAEAVIDSMEIAKKWEIKERMSKVKQLSQENEAMSEQMKQVQSDLQRMNKMLEQKDRETLNLKHQMTLQKREASFFVQGSKASIELRTILKQMKDALAELQSEAKRTKQQKSDNSGK